MRGAHERSGWRNVEVMKDQFSLKGETALITGGGTGLGLGIATCFAEAGAKVVLVGRRADVLEKSAAKIGKMAFFERHDVTKLDGAESLVKRAEQHAGPISI